MNGNGDTAPQAWQTVTPNVSNAVPITMDRNAGTSVVLNAPVDNTQIVNVPSNFLDGQQMVVYMVGGGGSGAWTQWNPGTPTVDGYVFVNSAAPTAPSSSANYVSIYMMKRGHKIECTLGLGTWTV